LLGLRRLLVLLCIGIPALLAIAAFLIFQTRPQVDRDIVLTPEHIERAKRILDGHNVRRQPGSLATLSVFAEDLEAAVNYGVKHLTGGSARVSLGFGRARVAASIPVGRLPLEAFVNVDATLIQSAGLPRLHDVRLGRLPLPDWLSNACAARAIAWAKRTPNYRESVDAIRQVRFSPRVALVVYRWSKDLPGQIGRSMASGEDFEHLRPYQERLAVLSRSGDRIDLAGLIPPMFALAAARAADGGDAIEAARAALLVLTMHAIGQPLTQITALARAWPRPHLQQVTLAQRTDTAKHFMVSAALTAYADTELADVIGLYKEISDSRGGSGFSFNDLAADRAGTRLGQQAAGPGNAPILLRRLAAGVTEADLLPPIADLPEDLQEAEFNQRFGGIGGVGYERIVRDIERRLDALPLLRPAGD
jgi:hypothetical protein